MTAASKTKGSTSGILEIPEEEIARLAETIETVLIKVRRRNDKGQLATLYSGLRFQTEDLISIEDWCARNGGGGRYRIDVYSLDAPGKRPMPAFEFLLEGTPRPHRSLAHPEPINPADDRPRYAEPRPGVDYVVEPGALGQAWGAGLHDEQTRAQFFGGASLGFDRGSRRNQAQLPPGATMASDALAVKQIAKLEAELAEQRHESKSLMARLEADAARAREEAQREREKAREERHQSEMAQLRMLIDAKSQGKEKSSVAEIAATLAPFVPVLQALVVSKSDAGSKALDAQMSGVNTLMQATLQQSQKPDFMETLVKFAPIVTPMIAKFFDSRSPEQQAALYQAMSEQNLNSVAMMAQLVEALAPADAEAQPWYPMIKETLAGIVNMTAAYTQAPGGLPGQRPAPLPSSGFVHGAQATAQIAAPDDASGSTFGDAPAQPTPSNLDALFTFLPQQYQTREWRMVLEFIHATPLDVAHAATALTNQLEHLISFQMLPSDLAALQDKPRETLLGLMQFLPVAQSNPQGASDVIDATLRFLQQDEFLTDSSPSVVEGVGQEVAAN